MSLSDADTLELTSLCSALADGTLTDAQRTRLNAMMADSDEARRFYLRHSALSASLFAYASELQSDAPVAEQPVSSKRRYWIASAVLASLVIAVGAWMMLRSAHQESVTEAKPVDMVAFLTGTKDCEWLGAKTATGDALSAGQRLQLQRGFAEITFDSGAQVTIEAPASLVVTSAWDATLEHGALKASVPPEAVGFRLVNDAVEVVDLGTEFSMIAEKGGNAEVLVLKGSVEAAAHDDAKSIVLHETEARRFSPQGVTDVGDRDRKFARFAKLLKLDRKPMTGGYAHWTFDDDKNSTLMAESRGRKKGNLHAKFAEPREGRTALTEGRWGKALQFDGRTSARSVVPGISDIDAARTVAFWLKVPMDSPLAGGSGSVVTWGAKHKKSGMLTTSIGWNKQAGQGSIGTLRTDLGRITTIGTTPLRDGAWHHVAVVFVPDAYGSVQAKQYVDGRLDGSAVSSIKKGRNDAIEDASADALWLGRHPGTRAKKNGFFVGALDELFVLDRALAPQEIVRLMRENRPPETMLVGTP